MKRAYKTLERNKYWKKKLPLIIMSDFGYFLSIETTGLDPINDRIVAISVAKCHFMNDMFVIDDTFKSLVNPEQNIPAEVTKINKITNYMIKDAPTIDKVFSQVNDFIGNDANIIAFNVLDFVGPFLDQEMKRTGVSLNINTCFDLYSFAKAFIGKKKRSEALSLSAITKILNIKSKGVEIRVDLFNELYKLVPLGTEKAKIKRTRYWKKSYTCRYIYITTDYGNVRLNCLTGYFEEDTPGIFDIIDLDFLTEFIFEKQNVSSIYEFTKLYENN